MTRSEHPGRTALLVLAPMWLIFLGHRVYLHLFDANADFDVAGYNIHHLYTGVVIEIPAAFVLAAGFRRAAVGVPALVGLGLGSGLVLDEVVYMIATDGSNASHLLPVSTLGRARGDERRQPPPAGVDTLPRSDQQDGPVAQLARAHGQPPRGQWRHSFGA